MFFFVIFPFWVFFFFFRLVRASQNCISLGTERLSFHHVTDASGLDCVADKKASLNSSRWANKGQQSSVEHLILVRISCHLKIVF